MPLHTSTLDRFLLRMLLLSREIKISDNALASFIQIKTPIAYADAFGYPACITFGLLAQCEWAARGRLVLTESAHSIQGTSKPFKITFLFVWCSFTPTCTRFFRCHRTYRSNNFEESCVSVYLWFFGQDACRTAAQIYVGFEGRLGSHMKYVATVASSSKSSFELTTCMLWSMHFGNPFL